MRYKLSKRKINFAYYYLKFDRESPNSCFNSAYRSALAAGYSDSYSRKICSHMDWIELVWLMDKEGYKVFSESVKDYVYRQMKKRSSNG
ncbi:MAG: hypothetical protein ACOCUF_01135 [Patescibacteria group bacterium]